MIIRRLLWLQLVLWIGIVCFIIVLGNHIMTAAYHNSITNMQNHLEQFRMQPVAYGKQKNIKLTKVIFKELKSLPYPVSYANTITFSDSWYASRNSNPAYSKQATRVHEGCDLMYTKNKPNIVPVLSMTDGVLAQKGWLTLGGYRVGIQSKEGIYYYYAHLSSYADDLKVGDSIKAGQLLGFMGSTGYGPEGTKDKFPVHLHVGIYVNKLTKSDLRIHFYSIPKGIFSINPSPISWKEEEVSINPYPFLVKLLP